MNSAAPIQLAIVEDNSDICAELEDILSGDATCRCVCVCRNVRTAMRQIPPLSPDLVIMDINLPDGSGIEATAALKRLLPHTHIMMFTVYEESEKIFRALEAGASGYLLKRTAPEALISAVHQIKAGGVPMTGEVAQKVIQSFRRKASACVMAEHLTEREEEILRLLASGHRPKEVAAELSISVLTVNTHLKHIYDKLHVRSRTEAVIKYLK